MNDLDRIVDQAGQHLAAGRFDLAMPALESVVAQKPDHAEATRLLGILCVHAGQVERGLGLARRAAEMSPHLGEYWGTLGSLHAMLGRSPEAIAATSKAIEVNPSLHEAHGLLATLHMQAGDYELAEKSYADALRLQPMYPEARTNAAVVMLMTCRPQEGVAALRDAARDFPTHPAVLINYCVTLNYADGIDPQEILMAHQHYGRVISGLPAPAPTNPLWPNPRDPDKRLRVGLVSPDFNAHSVAYFVLQLLQHRDRARVEYIGYSLVSKVDEMTQRLGPHFDGWRVVSKMGDGPLVQQVRADQCDVVVDLCGLTFGNRMQALRLRAAPVQATYCGYPNTTGVPAIDVRLVDSITDPPGSEKWSTERLVRMDPCFLCYSGREDVAHEDQPPLAQNGFVTFGSFNSIKKITPHTIELWSRVLHAVPRARLVLKSPGMQARAARDQLHRMLKASGVPEVRVDLVQRMDDQRDHLAAYGAIDIALDTFPYNGTTTTCEALWMGVPVVTRRGEHHRTRVSTSLLSAIGLPELSADTDDRFVEVAAGLAGDAARLGELRRTLRGRMKSSPLCDGPGFARRFEAALRGVWRTWCDAR